MNISQIVLLSIICLIVLYFFKMRTILVDRLIMIFLFVGAFFFILFPDVSTLIANRIGIGRGTDMIFYFFILFSFFKFIGISSDIKRNDRSMTEVVREIAIQNARKGPVDEK